MFWIFGFVLIEHKFQSFRYILSLSLHSEPFIVHSSSQLVWKRSQSCFVLVKNSCWGIKLWRKVDEVWTPKVDGRFQIQPLKLAPPSQLPPSFQPAISHWKPPTPL